MSLMQHSIVEKKYIDAQSVGFLGIVIALLLLTLCTFFQGYYNARLHVLFLGIGALIFRNRIKKVTKVFVLSILSISLLSLLAMNKVFAAPQKEWGFFLHYFTWIALLLVLVEICTREQKMIVLRVVIIISCVCNIASLKVLFVDADASRLLAGSASEEEVAFYYSQGVGGYGYVYAMTFLTYGALVWLKSARSLFDKGLLTFFLITNYVFILYSSYTLAVILVLIITFAALVSKMQYAKANVLLALFALTVIVLGQPLLEGGIFFADRLGLEWIVKRLSQLNEARISGEYAGLTRSQLYLRSIESFFDSPFFGGNYVGGHSHLLDWIGLYGICSFPAISMLILYARKAYIVGRRRIFIAFYTIFFIFMLLDTCSTMQLPVVVFFACPLILNVFSEQ